MWMMIDATSNDSVMIEGGNKDEQKYGYDDEEDEDDDDDEFIFLDSRKTRDCQPNHHAKSTGEEMADVPPPMKQSRKQQEANGSCSSMMEKS